MLKEPNFFDSQPCALPKNAPANFYLSPSFGLSFVISSVAPNRSSTFYSYLITKIGNRNLNGNLQLSRINFGIHSYVDLAGYILLLNTEQCPKK